MEELDFIIESSKELMDNSIIYLEKELVNIRACLLYTSDAADE